MLNRMNNVLRVLGLILLAGCGGDRAVNEHAGLMQSAILPGGQGEAASLVTSVHQPYVQQQLADEYAEQAAQQWERNSQAGLQIAAGSSEPELAQIR